MFFLISYTIRKWQQFRENNRNFALTGVRIESIDSVQIYQFSIAKIMTFFLDTSVNVVYACLEDMEAHSGAMEAHWSCGGSPWSLASSPWGHMKAHLCRFIMEPWRSVLGAWRPILEPWRLTLGPRSLILGPWRLILGPWRLEPCMLTLKRLHA